MVASLTKEMVLSEPAGPRMDLWVALHALGYTRGRRTDALAFYTDVEAEQPSHLDYCWNYFTPNGDRVSLPRSSTDISAAWLVVEKVGRMVIEDCRHSPFKDGRGWQVWRDLSGGHTSAGVAAYDAPHAICRAALLAALNGELNDKA